MSTIETTKTQRNIKSLVNRVFSSRLFPFVMAAIMLLCYYASLDLAAIYLVAVAGILIFLFCDDLTPFITLIVFMNVIVSYKNSPSFTAGESNFYHQPLILSQIIILISLLVLAGIFRFAKTLHTRKFKPTPVFYSLCALSAVFLLNGVFSSNYTPMNLVYGIFQTGIYLGLFALLKDNLNLNKDSFERIALTFFALSIVLIVEFAVALLTYDNIYIDGELIRDSISFGWGVYNTMGMLLVLCVPPVIYLASRYKHGYLFTIYSIILGVACALTTSRQAMLGLLVIYPICLIYLFKRSRNKLYHLLVLIAAAIVGLVVVAVIWDTFIDAAKQVFSNIIVDGQFNANNRGKLYALGFEAFGSAPLFGVGFYDPILDGTMNNVSGLNIMPFFFHNTLLQMAASCGFIGLTVYVAHRCLTVMSYLNDVTVERTFISVMILVLLILSLLDVHMFDILPTLIYSSLLAALVASEKKQPEKLPKPRQQFIVRK